MARTFTLQQRAEISAGHRKINGMPVQRGTPEWYAAVQEFIKNDGHVFDSVNFFGIRNRSMEHNAAIYASHKAPGKLKHTVLWYNFFRYYIVGKLLEDEARRNMFNIDSAEMFWCDNCNRYQTSVSAIDKIVADFDLRYIVCPDCGKDSCPIVV